MIADAQALPAPLLAEAEDFLAMVQGVNPADFAPLQDFADLGDGPRVEMDSQQWCASLLQEACSPWVDGAAVAGDADGLPTARRLCGECARACVRPPPPRKCHLG